MGVHENIGFENFPTQGSHLNTKVRVCFNYDTIQTVDGVIVRDDIEEPFIQIIKLQDGRHVLTTECQYQFLY